MPQTDKPQTIRGILLDIEGTTSSVSFVYDVMFPYVRKHLSAYLQQNWAEDHLAPVLEQIAKDAGADSWRDWTAQDASPEDRQAKVEGEIARLMDSDIKATGLKTLQGMIWKSGFDSGELVADLFPDVPPALARWKAEGFDIRIYSSGSIAAQKLFFSHTHQGDLLPYFSGHYDTTIGSKKEATSFRRIAEDFALPPSEILFVSDLIPELDAAREAGMATRLSSRPGNHPIESENGHTAITSFDQISTG